MSDPDPTTADEQVRRLLADARHDEPLPDDVADRLDRVLAELQREERRTPPPVDLAARRRRRVLRTLLVAAAAVVVVGVGIRQVDLAGQDGDAGGSADSSMAESQPEAEAGGDSANRLVTGLPLELRSEDFDQQVRRLRADGDLASLLDDHAADAQAPTGSSADQAVCDDPAWGVGTRVPVRYDGRAGVLVLRPAAGEARKVDLYLCGETTPTRSLTVPAG